MTVTRESLYEEIWTEPMTKVAARYNVSSNFLARVCERMNVPRPGRGYWAQLSAGTAERKPSLPDALPGQNAAWARNGDEAAIVRALPMPALPDGAPARRAQKVNHAKHDVLDGAREHFEKAKETEGYLRPAKRRLLDLYVTKATLDRALRFVKALFTALRDRGHRVTFPPFGDHLSRPGLDERSRDQRGERYNRYVWGPDRPTVVYVGSIAIGLTTFELSDEVQVRYVDGRYVPVSDAQAPKRGRHDEYAWTHKRDMPSGCLCVRASSPYHGAEPWEKQWREEKAGTLSSHISEIVESLESAAVVIAALVAEGERQAKIRRTEWERQHEEWRREEAETRRLQQTKASRAELLSIVDDWAVAKQMEGFFADATTRTETLDGVERERVRERLRRARALLGGVDALERFRAWAAPDER